LRKKLPTIYWTFLIGSASLAAIPLITGGFYSKDAIVWYALAGEKGNVLFVIAALLGAFLTSVYTFRMVFVTFFGTEKTHVGHHAGMAMTIPLVVLAVLSTFAGFIELPHNMAHVQLFSDYLSPVLPETIMKGGMHEIEWMIQLGAAALSLGGVWLAYFFYVQRPELVGEVRSSVNTLYQFWLKGWGFDYVYNLVFVQPFVMMATVNKNDLVDKVYTGIVSVADFFHRIFAWTQSGIMRWYMMGIVIGTIVVVSLSLIMST
jgi:NADH-quinone oxidoreductase subunit L